MVEAIDRDIGKFRALLGRPSLDETRNQNRRRVSCVEAVPVGAGVA
jgi:hypothetical protein